MRRIETLIILLAIGFYAWWLHHFGFATLAGYIRLAGWGLALTISLESISRLANTLGWRVTIEQRPKALGLGEMFGARIAGEAVDYVTPTAQLGGQFTMALMVRRKLKMPIGLATSIVASLAESIGQIVFVCIAFLISLPLVASVHDLFWPAVGGLALAVVLAGGFLLVQTRGPFSYLWRAIEKMKLGGNADSDEVRKAAAEADAVLIRFYRHQRWRLVLSCLAYVIAWSMGPVEIYILLKLLHQQASVQVALLTEALGLLAERATFMIPGKLISQEGGKALILAMLGYRPQVGFAIGFLRRIKELVWVLLGLAVLGVHRITTERGRGLFDLQPVSENKRTWKIQSAQGE